MSVDPVRLAWLSPLPPLKTGVASYSSMLLPALASMVDTTVVVDQGQYIIPAGCQALPFDDYQQRRAEFDAVLYHLGNNPCHEYIYREAMDHPGFAVLHDLVLHHLIVEMTLARGYEQEYIEALQDSHGVEGGALAKGRAAGFHDEIANFLFPASKTVAERSRGVIVHNRYAAESLRRMGVTSPVSIIDHPFVSPALLPEGSGTTLRRELGFDNGNQVVGMFGFVTAAKRPEVVFEAFAAAASQNDSLRMLIVGESAPNVDLAAIAAKYAIPQSKWKATGYVSDENFDAYLAAVDRVVSLRFPSAGESSGALLRVFHAGKPVAVDRYAQFAEIPDDVATKVPLGEGEVEGLVRFMLDQSTQPAAAQRSWLEAHADVSRTAADYLVAIRRQGRKQRVPGRLNPIPLFPRIELMSTSTAVDGDGWTIDLTLLNRSEFSLRAATYGSPEYRLIATVIDGDAVVESRWLSLDGDVAPESTTSLQLRFRGPADHYFVELSHGLEGIPSAERRPFHTLEVAR